MEGRIAMEDPESVSRETLDVLKKQDWPTIIKQLTGYALSRVRSMHWATGQDLVPGGRDAADLAMEAITLVYTGKRRWDPDKNPDLLFYLKGVVKSLTGHLAISQDNQRRVGVGAAEEGDPVSTATDPIATADETLVEKEAEELVIAMIEDAIADDEGLQLVFEGLRDGMSPKEIADDLGLSVTKVYAMLQKLRRRARAISKKPSTAGGLGHESE
jgi:DNA-directed RNA polymerase specialized sigma24 family protein